MIGIYKVVNLIDGKVYIGQSINIEERWRMHRTSPFNHNSYSYNKPFYRAIRKHGLENFSFSVIEECNQEDLNSKEIYWISEYQSYPPKLGKGYNLTMGGGGYRNPNEDLDLIVDYLLNSKLSQTEIANKLGYAQTLISGINSGKYYFNKDLSYPLRKFQGKAKLKKEKIKVKRAYSIPSKSELLIKFNEFGYNKESVAESYNVSGLLIKKWCNSYGFKCQNKQLLKELYITEVLGQEVETKEKRSKCFKVTQINPETNEIIQEFDSIKAAAKAMNCCSNNIKKACDQPNRLAKGFKWSLKLVDF